MKYVFIRDHRRAFPVDLMCRMLGVGSMPFGYHLCPNFGRLVVSGGNVGPVSPKGHWLVHGPMDYSATGNRCFKYGGQKWVFKTGADSSF